MSTSRYIIFILVIFQGQCQFSTDLEFTYNSKSTSIKFLNKNFETKNYIVERFVPNSLIIYFLDHSNPDQLTSDQIDLYIKSEKYERTTTADEIYKIKAAKTTTSNANEKNDPPVEPPISGKIRLVFSNLNEIQAKKLKVRFLKPSSSGVAIFLESEDQFTLFSIEHLFRMMGFIVFNNQTKIISKFFVQNLFSSLDKKPIFINKSNDVEIINSKWIHPYPELAFSVLITKSHLPSNPTVLIEDERIKVQLSKTYSKFKINHENNGDKMSILIQKDDPEIIKINIPVAGVFKKVLVSIRDDQNKLTNIYRSSTQKGSFSSLEIKEQKAIDLLDSFKSYDMHLRSSKDTFWVEISKKETKSDHAFIKVTQSENKSSISIFLKQILSERQKFVLTPKNPNNLPIELFIVNSKLKKIVKLEFEKKKILIDQNIFFGHKFSEFLHSDDFLEDSIIPSSPVDFQIDIRTITNWNNFDTDIQNLYVYYHQSNNVLQIYLYSRKTGMFAQMQNNQLVFDSFYRKASKWTDEMEIDLPDLKNFNSVINFDFKSYEIQNHLIEKKIDSPPNQIKEKQIKSFVVVENKIWFVLLDSFQQQFEFMNLKLSTCHINLPNIDICMFYGISWREVDFNDNGLTIWDLYQANEYSFDKIHHNYSFEIIEIRNRQKCQILDKTQFLLNDLSLSKKYFFTLPDHMFQQDLVSTYCLDNIKTCVLILSDSDGKMPLNEELRTLKVDKITKTCEIKLRDMFFVRLTEDQLRISEKGTNEIILFEPSLKLNLKNIELINLFDVETRNLRSLSNLEKFSQSVYMACAFDKHNIIHHLLVDNSKTSWNLPFLQSTIDDKTINIVSYHSKGTIFFILSKYSFEIETNESSLGQMIISKNTLYENNKSHNLVFFKFFFNFIEPIVIKHDFGSNPISFQKLFSDEADFRLVFNLEANVHPNLLMKIYTILQEQTFEAYYIENKDGEIEIIIHNPRRFELFEVIDKFVWQKTENLIERINNFENPEIDDKIVCKNVQIKNVKYFSFIINYLNVPLHWINTFNDKTAVILVESNKFHPVTKNRNVRSLRSCGFSDKLGNERSVKGFLEVIENDVEWNSQNGLEII